MFCCLFLRFENNQLTVEHDLVYEYKYTEIDMHVQMRAHTHIHTLPVVILKYII